MVLFLFEFFNYNNNYMVIIILYYSFYVFFIVNIKKEEIEKLSFLEKNNLYLYK